VSFQTDSQSLPGGPDDRGRAPDNAALGRGFGMLFPGIHEFHIIDEAQIPSKCYEIIACEPAVLDSRGFEQDINTAVEGALI
jgi:hypothetical protein